jgi:hypothetical protein
MPRITKQQLQLHVAALIFYAALAFILLHAILFTTGTHTAGYDFFNYNWNFWWIRHTFSTPSLNVYENNFVMYPAMSNYGYHALTAFWYPLWALLEPLVGTLTAVNIIIFVGCVLNGYLLFVLLRREGVTAGVALIAGAALQALPISRYFYYNTHLNLMDWFWVPGQILLWQQIVAAKDLRRALWWAFIMGVALWGLLLTDLQFPIFVAFLLVPYGLWTLWVSPHRIRLIAAGLLAVGIGLALMWFAGPLPYIARWRGALITSPVEERPGVPFSGFFSMSATWWEWHSPSVGAFVTLVLASAMIISIRRVGAQYITPLHQRHQPIPLSPRWLWFAVMLPPLVLALGPTLMLGETAIPLPFRWMYRLTGGNFRMPWRLAPDFVIAALLFSTKTWTMFLNHQEAKNTENESGRNRTRDLSPLFRMMSLASAFLLLAVSVRLYETAPLQPLLYPYTFYERMGQERGAPYDDYVVLEVPTGAGTGEVLLGSTQAIQFQWYGIMHHKRMINGFISRAPLDSFYYLVSDDPMLSWLGQRRLLEPELVEQQLRERIFSYPIGYIVIHRDYIGRSSSTLQEIVGYLNTLPDLLCPYAVEGEAIVYRTTWHPDGCANRVPPQLEPNVYQIDIGTPGDEFYIGWGWHWQEQVAGLTLRWAGEYPQTQVYLDLPAGGYELTFTAQAFWENRTVQVLLNGVPLGDPLTITTDALREYSVSIPAEVIGDGQHITLTLAYDAVVVPADVGQSADPRRLALAVDWLRFTQRQNG